MRIKKLSWAVLVIAPAMLAMSALPALANGGSISPNPAHRPGDGPSSPHSVAPKGAIKAVVLRSWGLCSSDGVVWDSLNATWSTYGSRAIVIDYSDPDLCGDSFTLDALEASGADVVIVSDPAGGSQLFTTDEISAISTYVQEGHDLIGTYLTFAYRGSNPNTALAPLFGLVKDDGWTGGESSITPRYHLRGKHEGALKSLFRNLTSPYVSKGFDDSQLPGDGVWSANDRAGARIMAINADGSAAITLYTRSTYNAVFIANMPEYGGGSQDKQFLYNAIIYPARG